MSISTRETSDTSAMFSLKELAELEHERVREEEMQRMRARDDRAREQKLDQERRRAEEEARIAAEAEDRARRVHGDAEQRARLDARKQAELDVARIQAEAKVRLEADNAARAHELAVLRVRTDRGRQRLRHALIAMLTVVLGGGAVAAYGVSGRVDGLEAEAARLRSEHRVLVEAHQSELASGLAALERRHEELETRGGDDADADKARRALDTSLTQQGLVAYATALDTLANRLDGATQLTGLERRHADLVAWAAAEKRTELAAPAERAAAKGRALADGATLTTWNDALDALRKQLGQGRSTQNDHRGNGDRELKEDKSKNCTNPNDPICGLDGKTL